MPLLVSEIHVLMVPKFASQVESTFFSPLQLPSQTFSTQFLEKTSRKMVSMFGNCFYPPPPPLKNNNNKNKNKKISKHVFRPDLRPLLKHERIVGFCVWDMFSNSRCCLCSIHEANRIFAPLIVFLLRCLSH